MTRRGVGAFGALVMAAAALLTGCGTDDDAGQAAVSPNEGGVEGEGESHGTLVEGRERRGALLETSAEVSTVLPEEGGVLYSPVGLRVHGAAEVPRRADVERFERELPATEEYGRGPGARTVELDRGYVRQYTVMEGGGTRQLVVLGIDRSEAGVGRGVDWDWRSEWGVPAVDLGPHVWQASMDLQSHEITSFAFDGVG